jgi:hypothetical protein
VRRSSLDAHETSKFVRAPFLNGALPAILAPLVDYFNPGVFDHARSNHGCLKPPLPIHRQFAVDHRQAPRGGSRNARGIGDYPEADRRRARRHSIPQRSSCKLLRPGVGCLP